MAQPVLNDPDFRMAVGFAKGLAKNSGANELSPLLLLCGFVLALRAGRLSGQVKDLGSLDATIQEAASASGLKLSDHVEPFEKDTMPLSAALRELLSKTGDSVIALVQALFKSINNPGLKRLIDSLSAEEGFSETVRFASAIARQQGEKEVSPEHLVAGAFFAYQLGLLHKRPAVCAHLVANEPSVKALIETRGWTVDVARVDVDMLPLAASVEQALKEGDDESDPLMVALNAGIGPGSQILFKKRIAYHEAGHAVISKILRPEIGLKKVTIVDKDDSAGHVSNDLTSPYLKLPPSRDGVLDQVCVALAGRVAEQKKYGHNELDAGAVSDLSGATEMAWNAIANIGLDFEFGPVSLPTLAKAAATNSGWLFDQAQRRLQEVLKEALQRTETLVKEHWSKIEAVAQVLFDEKVLTDDDVITIMENAPAGNTFGPLPLH